MSIELNLINAMISTTGTSPLGAADLNHPDYIDASLILEGIIEEINADAMWFNTEVRTLKAGTDGKIVVPQNALALEGVSRRDSYRIRGQHLWDYEKHTDVIGKDAKVKLLINVALEDMPPIARQWIRAAARYQYFVDKDGSQLKSTLLQKKAERVLVRMQAQNIRLMNVNFFDSRAAGNFYTRRGSYERGKIIR